MRSAEADEAHATAESLRETNATLIREKETADSQLDDIKEELANMKDKTRLETIRAEDAAREAQRARDELAAREREVRRSRSAYVRGTL